MFAWVPRSSLFLLLSSMASAPFFSAPFRKALTAYSLSAP